MSAVSLPISEMQSLKVSLVQGATRWHDAPGNRKYYGALVRQAAGSDLIVLPETFLSGFSNDTRASAETMDGESVAWLRALAIEVGAVICSSRRPSSCSMCREGISSWSTIPRFATRTISLSASGYCCRAGWRRFR